jgi:hypothetical protein
VTSGFEGGEARRRALVALVMVAPVPSLAVAAAMIVAPGPTGQTLFLAAKIWLIVAPAGWHLLVERQPLSWSPTDRGALAVGLVTGLAAAAVIGLTAIEAGVFRVDVTALAGVVDTMGLGTRHGYLLAAAGWTFGNSLMEEYVYRWFVLTRCERLMRPALAVLASATIFTVHHVIALSTYLPWGLTTVASLGVFLGGALWAALYRRTRSIWPAWVSHVLADAAIFTVGWFLLFG